MKKLVSLFLVLVLTLAAVSAFAAPKNISEIQDLPEFPTVPAMKVKSSGSTTTVTLDAPVSWLAVVRNWVWENLEFNDGNVATYSTAGQKVSPGFGVWGWKANVDKWDWIDIEYVTADADTSDWVDGSYQEKEAYGDYGYHYNYYEKLTKHKPGFYASLPIAYEYTDWDYDDEGEAIDGTEHTVKTFSTKQVLIDSDVEDYSIVEARVDAAAQAIVDSKLFTEEEVMEYIDDNWLYQGWAEYFPEGYITVDHSDMYVNGGAYDMHFAYDGDTTDGVHVRYGTHGELVSAAVTVTGKNYLGLEQAPAKSVVTFSTGKNAKNKSVVYISNITEEIDENTKVSADFAMNGKCLRIK